MILTPRDVKLVKDVCLSTVLSRSQILSLGYFNSVSRCNKRLKQLADSGYLRALPIPTGQFAYYAGPAAKRVVGDKIASFLSSRKPSPRHVCHALAATDIRIALAACGYPEWRFEAQLRHSFLWGGVWREARPDGLAVSPSRVLFVEADLGSVSLKRYAKKLEVYGLYFRSGVFAETFQFSTLCLLTVCSDADRKRRISRLPVSSISHEVSTFLELGIAIQGAML